MLTQAAAVTAAREAGLEPASIVIKPLDGPGPTIAIEPDRYFYPASMLKTPLAMAAYTEIAEGRLRLDDRFEVKPGVMTTTDGPDALKLGDVASVEHMIELMITWSDNIATNMFYDILGRENATRIVQQRYGLARTAFHRKVSGSDPLIVDPDWDKVHRNAHSAGDAARAFELIATGAVPYADTLRGVLLHQHHNDRLNPALLPGDRFAHKTGSTSEVDHDGGILELADGRTYVIVVYVGLPWSEEIDARFAPFMRAIRPLL